MTTFAIETPLDIRELTLDELEAVAGAFSFTQLFVATSGGATGGAAGGAVAGAFFAGGGAVPGAIAGGVAGAVAGLVGDATIQIANDVIHALR